jgi:tRNA dimethylallyltransferase
MSWSADLAAPKPLVPVIVGPTAVGKTAVALELRSHWPITVISADSRQVYRRLDIGTAKPTLAEQKLVRHIGIDVIEPGERYSAGRYASDAAGWMTELPPDERPVVVGGTGFYVRALADGLFHEPPMDTHRRELLRNWVGQRDGLGRWAARLDPAFAGGGRQRAARAIEMALLTGRSLSWWQQEAKAKGVMRPWYVLLTLPRPILHARIEERTRWMLKSGFVEEVEAVLSSGVASDAPGLDAVGYREVVQYLMGDLPERELASKIVLSTRRYAKRQETWFRHQLQMAEVLTLDSAGTPADVARQMVEHWRLREGP